MIKSMNNLPSHIVEWLHGRGITDETITKYALTYKDGALTIPIHSPTGEFLYNKYRKDPADNSDKPKYWNDEGAHAALFGANHLSTGANVIICEGELDVLALASKGMEAVTTTGGAGTFRQAWVDLLKNHTVHICYDNDQAGWLGMQKVAANFMQCRLILLPSWLDEKGDITDYLMQGGDVDTLINKSVGVNLWVPHVLPTTHQDALALKLMLESNKDRLVALERNIGNIRKVRSEFSYIRSKLDLEIKRLNRILNPNDQHHNSTERIEKAKAVPLEEIFDGQVHQRGDKFVALCPFHNEKTPSFTIYTDTNKFMCFGCGEHGDVIDFIEKKNGVRTKEAIDILLNQ